MSKSNLTWNQIKINATQFAEEWKDETYEKGETQSFYNDFFEVFGIKRRSVAVYEKHVRKLNNRHGYIDLFWSGVLLVEQKSARRDLTAALEQADEYFIALSEGEKPRFQLACDFQTFILIDRDASKSIEFELKDLPLNVEAFAFMLGKQSSLRHAKPPVSVEASNLIGALYKSLIDSGYSANDLEKCLTRLVFCLFADDTGIFQPRGQFEDFIESRTEADGSNLGSLLVHLFQVLNTPEHSRQSKLDVDLAKFPYINGGLFEDPISIPSFDEQMRSDLLNACQSDWSAISPAIFGSLFQSVLNKEEQRQTSGYYTTEENIKKVIDDLFLTELKQELKSIKSVNFNKVSKLCDFQKRLGKLEFLDPACGCGNFLAVSYQELRKLEIDVLVELNKLKSLDLSDANISVVTVNQFYGIETRSYSVRIAETALWMVDHVANNDLSLALGIEYYRIPLGESPKIVNDDAMTIAWQNVMVAGSGKFIIGNPPYGGAKVQSDVERETIRQIANLGGSGGTLDRVCGWIIKAAYYLKNGGKIGFVTTNSIVQGEQVAQLWSVLYDRFSVEIFFAHQSFAWNSNSPGDAQVQVVILGFVEQKDAPIDKKLYEYDDVNGPPSQTICKNISPYLINGDNLNNPYTVVKESSRPINGLKKLKTGTKPIDGGYYILSEVEKDELLKQEPQIEKYVRPFVGGEEFLQGDVRYLLILKDITPKELKKFPITAKTIEKVKLYREGKIESKSGTRKLKKPNPLKDTPREFHITSIPENSFLVIPEVTSEKREYIPIAWLDPPFVPSNLVKFLENASIVDFALLTSAMHMAWVRGIAGKLEGRNRYSIQLAYNTFPIPRDKDLTVLTPFALKVLKARQVNTNQTLKELYDPILMPTNLRKAHREIDKEVDKIYMDRVARNDIDRLENLLNRYNEITSQSN